MSVQPTGKEILSLEAADVNNDLPRKPGPPEALVLTQV